MFWISLTRIIFENNSILAQYKYAWQSYTLLVRLSVRLFVWEYPSSWGKNFSIFNEKENFSYFLRPYFLLQVCEQTVEFPQCPIPQVGKFALRAEYKYQDSIKMLAKANKQANGQTHYRCSPGCRPERTGWLTSANRTESSGRLPHPESISLIRTWTLQSHNFLPPSTRRLPTATNAAGGHSARAIQRNHRHHHLREGRAFYKNTSEWSGGINAPLV